MRQGFALSVSLAALALTACGNSAEEADDPIAADSAAPAEMPATVATDDAAGPDGELTPGPAGATPGASATATPTPTTSATRATPTPSAVASVAKPASFATCEVCHSTSPGQSGIGPTLAGVFGRRAGAVPGFNYSDGMEAANVTWNQATLDRYLADPNAVAPGTTMPAPGLDAAGRRAVIDYLRTL